jgi:hypothetical protein
MGTWSESRTRSVRGIWPPDTRLLRPRSDGRSARAGAGRRADRRRAPCRAAGHAADRVRAGGARAIPATPRVAARPRGGWPDRSSSAGSRAGPPRAGREARAKGDRRIRLRSERRGAVAGRRGPSRRDPRALAYALCADRSRSRVGAGAEARRRRRRPRRLGTELGRRARVLACGPRQRPREGARARPESHDDCPRSPRHRPAGFRAGAAEDVRALCTDEQAFTVL